MNLSQLFLKDVSKLGLNFKFNNCSIFFIKSSSRFLFTVASFSANSNTSYDLFSLYNVSPQLMKAC